METVCLNHFIRLLTAELECMWKELVWGRKHVLTASISKPLPLTNYTIAEQLCRSLAYYSAYEFDLRCIMNESYRHE
jgi:hypothetical protein